MPKMTKAQQVDKAINYAAGEDDSGDKDGATAEQMEAIRRRAYNSTARAMASHGVKLTWAQADTLGDDAVDWMRNRLGLKIKTTDRGVVGTPES